MAVRDEAVTTGADTTGDMRKRNAGQATKANGGQATQDVKEKSKQKVCMNGTRLPHIRMGLAGG